MTVLRNAGAKKVSVKDIVIHLQIKDLEWMRRLSLN